MACLLSLPCYITPSVMSLPVFYEIPNTRECGAARFAHVRAYASMESVMCNKTLSMSKSFITHFTHKWFFSCMRPLMSLHLHFEPVALTTEPTEERFYTCVQQ
jgi:hypothetical protein